MYGWKEISKEFDGEVETVKSRIIQDIKIPDFNEMCDYFGELNDYESRVFQDMNYDYYMDVDAVLDDLTDDLNNEDADLDEHEKELRKRWLKQLLPYKGFVIKDAEYKTALLEKDKS